MEENVGTQRMKRIQEIGLLLVGAFLFALAVNIVIIPSDLGEGGVTGITIVLYYLYEWSPGLVSLVLNAALLVVGYKLLDKQTVVYTIITVVALSLFLHLTETWDFHFEQPFVSVVVAGSLSGLGIGLVFRAGGTTAGSTILAQITHKYFGWNISYGLLFIDVLVVVGSTLVIGIEKMILTIIMLYVATKVMEYVLEGFNKKKAVMIVTAKPREIADKVNVDMARGVTVLSGYGYYTKNEKEILYIIINGREVVKLKNIVKEVDNTAFVTIHDVKDVFGVGFIELSKT